MSENVPVRFDLAVSVFQFRPSDGEEKGERKPSEITIDLVIFVLCNNRPQLFCVVNICPRAFSTRFDRFHFLCVVLRCLKTFLFDSARPFQFRPGDEEEKGGATVRPCSFSTRLRKRFIFLCVVLYVLSRNVCCINMFLFESTRPFQHVPIRIDPAVSVSSRRWRRRTRENESRPRS